MPIVCKPFGDAKIYSWENVNRMKITVSSYGARVLALEAPDKHGGKADV